MIRNSLLSMVILLTSLASVPAHADKALERAQFMMRQLNAQKVKLESENAKLKAEIIQIKKDTDKQASKQKAGNKKLSSANKKKDQYIVNLKGKLRETLIALRKSENERVSANRIGSEIDGQFKRCVSNNHKLVQMNAQLVQNYNEKGCWDSISQSEPFTGIKQTEIENILQEYQFANEDLQVDADIQYEPVGEESVNPLAETAGSASEG